MTSKRNSTKNRLVVSTSFFATTKILMVFSAMLVVPCFVVATELEDEDISSVKAAAENGDIEAMCEMGRRYRNGIGVGRDDKEAAQWTM